MILRALGTLSFSLTALMMTVLSSAQGVVAQTSGPENRITILYVALRRFYLTFVQAACAGLSQRRPFCDRVGCRLSSAPASK